MAKGFKHGVGGANPLNFKVVGNPQPQNPKENTIWLGTDVKITGYDFTATEPETTVEGMAWIFTGTSSIVAFNALKKNGIQVYPIYAKQYVGGAWVDVTAKSYQNGAWVDWWNGELYKNGNEYDIITGGWAGYAQMVDDGDAVAVPTITKNSASMTMQQPGVSGGTVRTVNKVYISGYTQLAFDGTITGGSDNSSICRFCVWSEMGTTSRENVVVTKLIDAATTGAFTVDISSVNPGEYYIGFAFYTGSCKVVMRSLVMK